MEYKIHLLCRECGDGYMITIYLANDVAFLEKHWSHRVSAEIVKTEIHSLSG